MRITSPPSSPMHSIMKHVVLKRHVYHAIVIALLLPTLTHTFSVQWIDPYRQNKESISDKRDSPFSHDIQRDNPFSPDSYDPRDISYSQDNSQENVSPNKEYIPEEELTDDDEGYNTDHVDDYINILKRWGYGHRERFPWKRLPRRYCYKQRCQHNHDCCYSYNRCATDLHTPVCIDCWYKSICKSEADCCKRYPYCKRIWHSSKSGGKYVRTGHCVESVRELYES